MDILCDTGILLRLFEPLEPLRPVVDQAVALLRAGGDRLVVGFQNVAEFWNVCTRPSMARGGLGLTVSQAEARLRRLEAAFHQLSEPPSVYPNWRQLVVTHAVLGKQVHDARLVALMLAHGITHILTLNGADFARYPGITVLDPVQMSLTP